MQNERIVAKGEVCTRGNFNSYGFEIMVRYFFINNKYLNRIQIHYFGEEESNHYLF